MNVLAAFVLTIVGASLAAFLGSTALLNVIFCGLVLAAAYFTGRG